MDRLLFIGDSLIEYFDWEGRFPGHTVYNLGIAGETADGNEDEEMGALVRDLASRLT